MGAGLGAEPEAERVRRWQQPLLAVAWCSWTLWAVAYGGLLTIAAFPLSGGLMYCVAEDGSPSGADASLSLFPFGPKCTSRWSGESSGPYLVWTIWLLAGLAGLVGLVIATRRVFPKRT